MTHETDDKPTSPPEKAATSSYGDKLREILTTPLGIEADDEDRHFALSIVPMLKRLPEEEKHFAKVSILNAFRNVRVGRGLRRTPTVQFPSMAPYCISGMPAVPMVQPHMPGQPYISAQPSNGQPQMQYNGQHRVPVQPNGYHQISAQPFNGQPQMPVQSNGYQQMPMQPPYGQPRMPGQSNGQPGIPGPGKPRTPVQSNGQPGMYEQSQTPVQSGVQPSQSNGLPKISKPRSLKRPSSTSPPASQNGHNVRIKVERQSPEVVVYNCDDSTDSLPTAFFDILEDASKSNFPAMTFPSSS